MGLLFNNSSSSFILFKPFNIISFLIVLDNNLFLGLVTILAILEKVDLLELEVTNIVK